MGRIKGRLGYRVGMTNFVLELKFTGPDVVGANFTGANYRNCRYCWPMDCGCKWRSVA